MTSEGCWESGRWGFVGTAKVFSALGFATIRCCCCLHLCVYIPASPDAAENTARVSFFCLVMRRGVHGGGVRRG